MFSLSSLAFWKAQRIAQVPADTYPTPTATACSPTTTPQAGGGTITITGTGFMTTWGLGTVSAVRFGATLATSFTIVSATSLTAVAPAHAAGAVPVIVTTLGGQANKAAGVTFT